MAKNLDNLEAFAVRMQRMQEIALERAAAKAASAKPQTTNVVRLPVWPDAVRAVPNVCLRSALFGAIAKGRRRYLERELIAAVEGLKIFYTGARLDQGDLDVWETVLHLTKEQALGNECRVTAYQMLKLMGKNDAGTNRATLHTWLMRLKATAVEMDQGRYSYAGSLIDEVCRDKDNLEYVIRLNPKLRPLFDQDQYTQIDWAVRQSLDGHPLAQWLHGFYASHAKPYLMKIDTLLRLAGSENTETRSNRQKVKKALDAVVEAVTANGGTFVYAIQGQGDLVSVEKMASKAQQRHLTKKKGKQ